jgi:hypothetical protein
MKSISALLVLSLLIVAVAGKFVHPGLLHTTADLQRIKTLVASERQPWLKAFQTLLADSRSSLSYTMAGPDAVVTRDVHPGKTNPGTMHLADDSVAALQLALIYSITGNESYAQLATRILEAWTDALIIINGMLVFIDIFVCFNQRNSSFRFGCPTCCCIIWYTTRQCC